MTCRYGTYDAVALENGALRLVVLPRLGAKAVSLVDRRSGREWLTQGRPGGSPDADTVSPDAVFDGGVAYGWDECLPSVAPAPDPVRAGARLRDHGDAWGRPTETTLAESAISTTWYGLGWQYTFRRRVRLDGPAVDVAYELVSRTAAALPFLWSMHPLLDLEPGARIELPSEVAEVAVSQGAGAGLEPRGRIGWPIAHGARGAVHLDEVRGIEAGEATKLYAGPLSEGRAAVATATGGRLTLRWETGLAPFVGLWLDYGGWPSDEPGVRLHQVAIEPTTAPCDDLPTAIGLGRAVVLEPGAHIEWWARLEFEVDGPA